MDFDKLLKSPWKDVIDNVNEVSTLGTKFQIQSVMLVPAKCAIEVSEALEKTRAEIRSLNESTSSLTERMISLNKVLTFATVVGAVATVVLGAIAAYQFCHAPG